MELKGVRLVVRCLLIILGLVVAQAIPEPAHHLQSDLMVSRYGELLGPPNFVLLPKDDGEAYDDNMEGDGGTVLEGFDEGGGEDCDKLPYGPTTQGGKDQLTPNWVFSIPLSVFIIQLLS
ncbi:uncharacterized protein [Drosophila takahashii]|uniref:uncharacterized protein n=1 Tax=Drosophila takahashii TaxID=29030 RepID=UPI0038995F93